MKQKVCYRFWSYRLSPTCLLHVFTLKVWTLYWNLNVTTYLVLFATLFLTVQSAQLYYATKKGNNGGPLTAHQANALLSRVRIRHLQSLKQMKFAIWNEFSVRCDRRRNMKGFPVHRRKKKKMRLDSAVREISYSCFLECTLCCSNFDNFFI